MTVQISAASAARLKLIADRETIRNVAAQLVFEVPNAQHQPKVKAGLWDGKIRLMNAMSGEAPIGLYGKVAEVLEELGIEYELSDFFEADESIPNDIAMQIAKDCGAKLVPHDYQCEAIYEAIAHRRRLIISPTGSGKSFTTFLLNKYFESQGINTLIVVPRQALAKQLSTDYIDYQGHAKGIHTITGGVTKETQEATIISTWQSIYKQPKEWFDRFGAVIVDEAHDAKATSLTQIMTACDNVVYRVGLTGTTDDVETNELTLQGHFGPKVTVAETWELIEQGVLADLLIKVVNIDYDDDTRRAVRKIKTYADEKTFLKLHKGRNDLIAGLAASQAGNVLVLVEQRDQLDDLVTLIKRKTNREVFIIHGDIPISEREKTRKSIESMDDVILIATFGSFSVGSNVKRIAKCILATSFKSKIRVLQSIGRTLRKGNGADSAVVYDLADDLTYDGKPNFTLLHARSRIEYYVRGKLKWKMINVKMKTLGP